VGDVGVNRRAIIKRILNLGMLIGLIRLRREIYGVRKRLGISCVVIDFQNPAPRRMVSPGMWHHVV
jgi:hypothetical protein